MRRIPGTREIVRASMARAENDGCPARVNIAISDKSGAISVGAQGHSVLRGIAVVIRDLGI